MIKNKQYLTYLSQLFSASTFVATVRQGSIQGRLRSALNKSEFENTGFKGTYGTFYSNLFSSLKQSYRNEYVYKNIIANKILAGRHSDISTLLSELRVGHTKADVVILNGSSTVYEIKSEFDDADRLENQLYAYQEMFDKIYLLVHESAIKKFIDKLPQNVGLMVLTKRHSLKPIREARSNKANVNPETIFNTFNRTEHEAILNSEGIEAEQIPNTQIYEFTKSIFLKYSPVEAHDLMVRLLKMRSSDYQKNLVKNVPPALKFTALTTASNSLPINRVQAFLNQEFVVTK